MKKILLYTFFFAIQSAIYGQNPVRKVSLNIDSYLQQLAGTKHENTLGIGNTQNSETIISLPLPDGSSSNFKVIEYSILPKGVNSDAKTYLGEQVDNPAIGCRITMLKEKLIATIQSNGQIIVVERDKQSAIISDYNVFIQPVEAFECGSNNILLNSGRIKNINGTQDYRNGSTLRTYRMAFIVTDEFYIARGNTDATINNEVTAILNSLNGVFERELAVRFTLVSPNNPTSANVFYRKTSAIGTYYQNIDIIRAEMNTLYGTANYDLGHALHTNGGGVAYYGVCNNNYKGGGWSGSTTPSSIYLMAHEVGHQFTAPHTFSGFGGSCTGNISLSSAYEPGSGSTIMSYSGLCGANQNLTGLKETYFHTNSLDKMVNYIQTGTGSTCGTTSATGNTAPVASAGANYTIPKNTPFVLTGSGTDANGNTLSYTWEEYDLATNSDVGALGNTSNGTTNAVNSTTAPLFRSKQSSSPVRTFPSLGFILNNANNPPDTEGEDLPNVARTMLFRLTARDNRSGGGGVDMDETAITISNVGPFLITSQNSATLWIYNGSNTATITWSHINTNIAPINCTNVKISLSTDGGQTFPIVLAASTPNDGEHIITIPNNLTSTGRIKVEAIGNIFFDINNINITISNNCTPETSLVIPSNAVSQVVGSPTLNLSLLGVSNVINGFSGTIANTDTPTTITVRNSTSGACQSFGNSTFYDEFTFIPDVTGTYTFSNISWGHIVNIYQTSYNPSNKCNNWLGSSAHYDDQFVNFDGSLSVNLIASTSYKLIISGFSGVPDPASYSVSISSKPINSNLYNPLTGSPYAYTYAIYNTNSGTIINFEDDPNLSVAGTYPEGSYRIYGLSYQGGLSLIPYDGTSFTSLQNLLNNGNICGKLSSNFINVFITSNTPCSNNVILANPTDNITSGNTTRQASAINGKITATNYVTGVGTKATYQAKAIELNTGFKADIGTIFRAETGGCN